MYENNDEPFEDEKTTEPEYVDEVFAEPEGELDPWADASPLRSARLTVEVEEEPEIDTPIKPPAPMPVHQASTPRTQQPVSGRAARTTLVGGPSDSQSDRKPNRGGPFKNQPVEFKRSFPHNTQPAKPGKPTVFERPENRIPMIEPRHGSELPVHRTKADPVEDQSTETQPDPISAITTAIPEWVILEQLIKDYAPLPLGSLILGVDQAGKPLLLSLDDPSLGSMLLLGDRASANRKHIWAILASAEKLNEPDLFQVDVITPNPEGFTSNSSTLRQVCTIEDDCVFGLLGDILTEVEARLRTDRRLPFQLLILDQLDELTGRLAQESLRFLRWILRRGPQVGIWPIASIESANLEDFDLKTFRSFGLRIYGKITEGRTATRFTEVPPQLLRSLSPGNQACFKLEESVIAFSIPEVA